VTGWRFEAERIGEDDSGEGERPFIARLRGGPLKKRVMGGIVARNSTISGV
jgi:hypothetical protein